MGFSRNSLSQLRERIDLVEVMSPYVKLQRSGSYYKGLCPFHEEKTPSFVIQKGDHHYHCFGCGAHGDAIQFLLVHLKMNFVDAVETLAERFGVMLEAEGETTNQGPSKAQLKDPLERACRFYQFCLLYTSQGQEALQYLYQRGIDLSFIKAFRFGFAPNKWFMEAMREQKISKDLLLAAGLLNQHGREFFFDRIMIPILDAMGSIIGFTARGYLPHQHPKYINSPETPLFKKSKVLFGLSYSRKRIAKERRALIVEGQIDALRLIHCGFDWTVAGQGTACTEEHVQELIHLGVREVFLAFDADRAGREAAVKVGHLFQKEGVDVLIVPLEEGSDPDLMLREKGPEEWNKRLEQRVDYLSFLVQHFSKSMSLQTPAGKNELVQTIAKRIREWNQPLMIHESLRKLATLTNTPESLLLGTADQMPQPFLQTTSSNYTTIDPDRILEADLLRLLLIGKDPLKLIQIAQNNLNSQHLRIPYARRIFEQIGLAAQEHRSCDLLSLAIEKPEEQAFLEEILNKKINLERSKEHLLETIQRILDRSWMQQREEIKLKIYSNTRNEEEILRLAKQFDELKRTRPLATDG